MKNLKFLVAIAILSMATACGSGGGDGGSGAPAVNPNTGVATPPNMGQTPPTGTNGVVQGSFEGYTLLTYDHTLDCSSVMINNERLVVGNCRSVDGTPGDAFLWDVNAGAGILPVVLPGKYSVTSINSAGLITGLKTVNVEGNQVAVLLTPLGEETTLPLSRAAKINNAGVVVGTVGVFDAVPSTYTVATSTVAPVLDGSAPSSGNGVSITESGAILIDQWTKQRAVVSVSGVETEIDKLGMLTIVPAAMNEAGMVVGHLEGQTTTGNAFVWDGTQTINVHPSGADYSRAIDVNNLGEVLLQVNTQLGFGMTEFFVWKSGVTTKLPQLSSYWTEIASINDRGDITGWYSDDYGRQRAFVALKN